ncbi:MAG: class I SAM-dependent methyltransferase [Chthoniobacterales bacterium]
MAQPMKQEISKKKSPENNPFLIPDQWRDYELLDSGNEMKLERWGDLILIRPEIEAAWSRQDVQAWKTCDAQFHPSRSLSKNHQEGAWTWNKKPPQQWTIRYRDLRFLLRPTASKQLGVFPEQAVNWDWCMEKIKTARATRQEVRLLNLFGYSGAATIAAVAAGATVTHVDASKPMVNWCAENARTSGFMSEEKKAPIRFIVDDCAKFIAREIRRERHYDAIILDPPTFGHGGAGELWKLEDQLLSLLTDCKKLLSNNPLFLLMSAYTSDLSAALLQEILSEVFGEKESARITGSPLGIKGSLNQKIIPCGVTARWCN